jgi:caa(3)-type oxidase subunit IV
MNAETSKPMNLKKYIIIFIILSVLTLVQIIAHGQLSPMPNSYFQSIVALIKVTLVAWWFMHLNEEPIWLRFIALLPCFAIIYTVFVTVETLVR